MKYIFLDFDGVLNTEKHQANLRSSRLNTCDDYGPIFDPDAVECLRSIISKVPDCCIVIISSWKFEGEDRMRKLWQDRSLPGVLAGITPTLIPESLDDLYAGKGREIKVWLSHNPAAQYVILDDDCDMLDEQLEYFVSTSNPNGLTDKLTDRAIEILNHGYVIKAN